jgi:predicted transcriptional regulator
VWSRPAPSVALRGTLHVVQKTSVYLSDEEVARLVSLARREGTSQAEVIRRAIRSYQPRRPADRDFSLVGSADGPGGSVAELTEEQLLEGFGA